ncbi:MAG: hypothetical protein V1802_02505, partial [Candidatus Aenigmatarchaeota archaeon]
RVVKEVILFTTGIMITMFIVASFSDLQKGIGDISLKDQYASVAAAIASGIVKNIESQNNAEIRIAIPESTETYRIIADNRIITVMHFSKPSINATHNLFNMGEKYNISGEALSTGKYVRILFNRTNVRIMR